jgi:hypothetical protein
LNCISTIATKFKKAKLMSDWFEDNKVPPHPTTPEWYRLSELLRDWHPAYQVGDRVRRRFLGGDAGSGVVKSFSWSGNHLMADVDFGGNVETFVASEYVSA